jgi:hypothetical protein
MLDQIQRDTFLASVDRVYKSLNGVARFARANKLDPENDPLDVRSLQNLAGACNGLQEAAMALVPQPLTNGKK